MALNHTNEVQVLFDLFHVDWNLVELYRLGSEIFFFDVQIEDVEEWQPRPERVVKVLHSLVLCCGNLHIRVEELDYICDPG